MRSRTSPKNAALLLLLTVALRAALAEDIATMLGLSPAYVAKFLRGYQREGLVRALSVLAAPPARLEQPLIVLKPGTPAQSFSDLSTIVRRRAVVLVPRRINIWTATPRAARVTGGEAAPLQLGQVHHSPMLGKVLIARMAEIGPDVLARWRSDQIIKFPHETNADAYEVDASGRITLAHDYLGAYGTNRLVKLYRFANDKEISVVGW